MPVEMPPRIGNPLTSGRDLPTLTNSQRFAIATAENLASMLARLALMDNNDLEMTAHYLKYYMPLPRDSEDERAAFDHVMKAVLAFKEVT